MVDSFRVLVRLRRGVTLVCDVGALMMIVGSILWSTYHHPTIMPPGCTPETTQTTRTAGKRRA